MIDLTTKVELSNDAMKKAYQQQEKLQEMGHVGTHLDTYLKTSIPLSYFKSTGILCDVSHIGQTRDIELSDIENVNITEGAFVLFQTGQMKKYGYGNQDYFNNHPQLSQELITYLLQKKMYFIGIDCAGIRRGAQHQEADRYCEDHGVYVIENLSNLEDISTSAFTVYTMWLDDPELTGLRCRVLVE